MRTLLIATAAAAVAASAPAAAETRFEHDGYTYVYKAEAKGDRQIVSGHRFPGNAPFRLVVRGDKVSGTSNGVPVSFRTAQVERLVGVDKQVVAAD